MPRLIRLVAAVAALAGLAAAGLSFSGGSGGGYVVRPGDSLWAIAASHATTVARLAQANNLEPDAVLPIGRTLTIPGSPSVRTADLTAGRSPAAPVPVGSLCASVDPGRVPVGVAPAGLAGHPSRLALVPLFERWAASYHVPTALLEAVDWQESGWQQDLVSVTGAVGIGQIEPATARFLSAVVVGHPLDIRSVSDNIRLSASFLSYLSGVEGSRCAVIAAYYQGPLSLATRGAYRDTVRYVADVEALVPRFS